MSGDYGRFQPIYGLSLVDVDLPTVQPILIQAKGPLRKITVQRIVFSPTVYVTATMTFLDNVTGAVIATFSIPNVQPQDVLAYMVDFGPTGTTLAAGSHLQLGVVGGAAGRLHIEAYQKGPLPSVTVSTPPQTAGVTA